MPAGIGYGPNAIDPRRSFGLRGGGDQSASALTRFDLQQAQANGATPQQQAFRNQQLIQLEGAGIVADPNSPEAQQFIAAQQQQGLAAQNAYAQAQGRTGLIGQQAGGLQAIQRRLRQGQGAPGKPNLRRIQQRLQAGRT